MAEHLIPIGKINLVADPRTQTPVMVLYAHTYNRLLPIWIDHPEARVIAMCLDGVVPPRPLTHHLLKDILGAANGKIIHVVVTKVENGTFFAELKVRIGRKIAVIDARPSDAIALALLTKASVFVTPSVLEEAGHDGLKPLTPDQIKKISQKLSQAQKREEQS